MSEKKEQSDQRIEIISAIMLAVIIVAIAWCAYQATLWNGIQTFKLRDENTASLKFVLNTIQQEQHSMADSILFTEYVNALHDNKKELSNFYYASFRPDMKVAVDAWLATNPLNDPHAPQTPFEMHEYNESFDLEAHQFVKESDLKLGQAQEANRNSDNYTLMTVIYAGVLFIGSMLGKMFSRQVRLILLITGLSITTVATIIVFILPIATE